MPEWQPFAISAAYLAGVAYCISATWDEPGGWEQDLAHALSAILWPIAFVYGLVVGVLQGLQR